jgi:ubiquinol-cytochrome c reductase iron-sulfur subunit
MSDAVVMADDGAVDLSRRKFLTAAASATAGVGAVLTAVPFVASWSPSERVKALGAPIEFDLSKLQPGQLVTVLWRKQPIYIVSRPQAIVDQLAAHDGNLKDPQSSESDQPAYAKNEMRSVRADVLVLIGTCTHLGCLPKQRFEPGDATLGADWPGGFYCPCHGSRFDLAGRVFAGSPASLNLRIPPYSIEGNKLLIGQDGGAAQGVA